MSNIKKNLSKVREKIENAMEQAEEDHQRRLLHRRMELARAGIAAAQARQIEVAVKAFHSYLKILEEAKGVREGALIPANFDRTTEMAEMLLISGVYWELVKIYDKTKSPDKQRVFHQYLEKFILFSRGMSFQALSTEMLRKYLNNEKPVHKSEFKNAYKMLGGTGCFVATSLIDVIRPETLPRLRSIRDETLSRYHLGRQFIQWYYRQGPNIANQVDHLPNLIRKILAQFLDLIAWAMTHLVNQSTDSVRSERKLSFRKTHPK